MLGTWGAIVSAHCIQEASLCRFTASKGITYAERVFITAGIQWLSHREHWVLAPALKFLHGHMLFPLYLGHIDIISTCRVITVCHALMIFWINGGKIFSVFPYCSEKVSRHEAIASPYSGTVMMKCYLNMSLWVLSSSQKNATNIGLKINQIIIEHSRELNSCSASPLLLHASCFFVFPSFLSRLSTPSFHHSCGAMTEIDRGVGSWRKRWIFKIGHLSRSSHCFPLSVSVSPWGLDPLLLVWCGLKCMHVCVCVSWLVVLYWHSKASVVRRWHLAVSMQH